jgi:hypothetical protein
MDLPNDLASFLHYLVAVLDGALLPLHDIIALLYAIKSLHTVAFSVKINANQVPRHNGIYTTTHGMFSIQQMQMLAFGTGAVENHQGGL